MFKWSSDGYGAAVGFSVTCLMSVTSKPFGLKTVKVEKLFYAVISKGWRVMMCWQLNKQRRSSSHTRVISVGGRGINHLGFRGRRERELMTFTVVTTCNC